MDAPIAELDHVSFRYGRRPVFSDLTLTIQVGVTGLLGPNGAGKSTLQSLISTYRSPKKGSISVLGRDVADAAGRRAVRSQLGVLEQRFPLVGSMRVLDTVAYSAWAQGLDRSAAYEAAERSLAQMAVGDLASRRCRALSGGQRQRVGLATAMVHSPQLLILDEPSTGLDPQARIALRKTLAHLTKNCSILLSTHLVDDVLAVSDRIVVLNHGTVAFNGTPDQLSLLAADTTSDGMGSALELGYVAALSASRRP